MKKWFERFFRQEAPLDYIIADYKPEQLNRLRPEYQLDEMELDGDLSSADEMYVDNLYQH
jgi:hypothetical protein